jgi:GNAT superfamily N-acetyltransferase
MSAFHIREAHQNDIAGIAKVRVDTWRATYKGIVPDDFIENLSYQSTAEGWQKAFWENRSPGVVLFVAENERKDIIGIAVCGPERGRDPVYQGEIYVLYVLPEFQNQGIGHQLVAACVQHLIHQLHVTTMLIWAFAESPYRRFYESLDGKLVRENAKEIGGRMIPEVGFGWDEIQKLALE